MDIVMEVEIESRKRGRSSSRSPIPLTDEEARALNLRCKRQRRADSGENGKTTDDHKKLLASDISISNDKMFLMVLKELGKVSEQAKVKAIRKGKTIRNECDTIEEEIEILGEWSTLLSRIGWICPEWSRRFMAAFGPDTGHFATRQHASDSKHKDTGRII